MVIRKPIITRIPIITARKPRKECPYLRGVSNAKRYAAVCCDCVSYKAIAFSSTPEKFWWGEGETVHNTFTYPEGVSFIEERDLWINNWCSHKDDWKECGFYKAWVERQKTLAVDE